MASLLTLPRSFAENSGTCLAKPPAPHDHACQDPGQTRLLDLSPFDFINPEQIGAQRTGGRRPLWLGPRGSCRGEGGADLVGVSAVRPLFSPFRRSSAARPRPLPPTQRFVLAASLFSLVRRIRRNGRRNVSPPSAASRKSRRIFPLFLLRPLPLPRSATSLCCCQQ